MKRYWALGRLHEVHNALQKNPLGGPKLTYARRWRWWDIDLEVIHLRRSVRDCDYPQNQNILRQI